MSNKDVAIKWRSMTKDNGHSLNVFFEKRTIYSYGYHFPMAYITESTKDGKTIVLQNSDGYSNSTAKHLNYMRSECFGDAVATLSTELLKRFIDAMKYSDYDKLPALKEEAKTEIEARKAGQEEKLSRARAEHMKEMYQRDIEENNEQLEVIAAL